MRVDFRNGKELLDLCREHNLLISDVMRQREITCGSMTNEQIDARLKEILTIMKNAAHTPLETPTRSIGGLIGGEAKKTYEFSQTDNNLCGSFLSRAISYSMAVLEVNATMGLIVAAPTAGSAGVLPGVLLALQEDRNLSDEAICSAIVHASAIGYILMRNASVSGAEAGCQAEVGAASAMAASAVVEVMGGTPEMSLHAASIALSNLLGMVCDPIAGLVEAPCQSRNSIGAANAITCAQLALSGVTHPIPFDEMAEAMYRVGKSIPFELRETAMGGNAGTPTACTLCGGCCK
jgi:L-serine dehydratase